jgi:hypothetical protein
VGPCLTAGLEMHSNESGPNRGAAVSQRPEKGGWWRQRDRGGRRPKLSCEPPVANRKVSMTIPGGLDEFLRDAAALITSRTMTAEDWLQNGMSHGIIWSPPQ